MDGGLFPVDLLWRFVSVGIKHDFKSIWIDITLWIGPYLLGTRSCWWVKTAKLFRTVLKLARTYEKNNNVGPCQEHILSLFFLFEATPTHLQLNNLVLQKILYSEKCFWLYYYSPAKYQNHWKKIKIKQNCLRCFQRTFLSMLSYPI